MAKPAPEKPTQTQPQPEADKSRLARFAETLANLVKPKVAAVTSDTRIQPAGEENAKPRKPPVEKEIQVLEKRREQTANTPRKPETAPDMAALERERAQLIADIGNEARKSAEAEGKTPIEVAAEGNRAESEAKGQKTMAGLRNLKSAAETGSMKVETVDYADRMEAAKASIKELVGAIASGIKLDSEHGLRVPTVAAAGGSKDKSAEPAMPTRMNS